MPQQDDYLSVEELLEIQKEDTREIIQALLEDGSDADMHDLGQWSGVKNPHH